MAGTINIEILKNTNFDTKEKNEMYYVDLEDLMQV